ncbi:MAG: BamA/TamA family outer membrane protein [Planctomycetes bacterium]|nr:BamA/TamA family outer membrane protein [Planctomycetota bacterium]
MSSTDPRSVGAAPFLLCVLAAAAGAQSVRHEYEGNQGIPDAELEKVLEGEAKRYKGGVPSDADIADAAFLLSRYYRRQGYAKARVEGTRDSKDRTLVHFGIDEGKIWYMDGPLDFVPEIPVPEFEDWWQRTSSYARKRYVTRYPIFNENQIANDLDAAKDWLAAEGYHEIRLRARFEEVDEDPPRMRGRVDVDLGPRTLVGSVRFDGLPDESRIVLLQRLGLEPWPDGPVPYYPDLVVKWKIALVRFFKEKGHRTPEIDPSVSIATLGPRDRRANVTFSIRPGPHYRVREVAIFGNLKTGEGVIREVFGVEPGDPYSIRRIDEGRLDLLSLDLFATVVVDEREVGPSGQPEEAEREVDLVVRLDEKPSKFVGFNLGFGVFERVRAGLDLQVNNLFGSGMGIRTTGSVSNRSRRADVKFVNPFPFGDTDNHLELGPFVERQERPAYTVHRTGAELDFTRKLSDELTLDLGWTWEFSDIRHLGDGLDRVGEGDHVFSGPRAEIEWDLRDSKQNPTDGWILGLSLETSSPTFGGGGKDLATGFAKAGWYQPVATFQGYPVVFFAGLRAGVVQPLFSTEQVPVQKRLFNGGEYSVRSFERDRLGPLNFFDTPVGGELSLTANFETTFNIYKELWGVGFVDLGLVDREIEDFDEFRRHELGIGVGTGLRYQTPIGPIRMEIAFNPHRRENRDEDLFEVLFTIGFRF